MSAKKRFFICCVLALGAGIFFCVAILLFYSPSPIAEKSHPTAEVLDVHRPIVVWEKIISAQRNVVSAIPIITLRGMTRITAQ